MALQARLTLPEHGGSLIRRLADEGCSIRASTWRTASGWRRTRSTCWREAGAGVVLNPQGNLKMKCGIPPIRALQDAGVRIGLGCDNCSCSDAQNMFVAMKLYALLAAVSDPIPGPPQAAKALHAATEAGAEGARLGHAIGRIAPGYKADLTLIDMSDPSWSPLNSAVRQLVHVEAGRGVRHVIVDGAVVVRDRRLTTIDEDDDLRRGRGGDARLPPRLRGDLRARQAPAALARPGACAHRGDRDGLRPDLHSVLILEAFD